MRALRWAAWAILGLGALLTGGWLIGDARWNTELPEILLSVLFGCWAVGPYAVLGALCATSPRHAAALRTALIGSPPPVAFGLWMYINAFYVQPPDAQTALIYLFVPLIQWGWTAGVFVMWAVLRARSRSVQSHLRVK